MFQGPWADQETLADYQPFQLSAEMYHMQCAVCKHTVNQSIMGHTLRGTPLRPWDTLESQREAHG